MEWSVISVVDLDQHTGYSLSAQQTEAGLAARAKAVKANQKAESLGNRVDFDLGHLAYCRWFFPKRVKHLVGNLFYSKLK